ncbi:uncharacterized protein LOC116023475 [Ipomoea triloba]|uniref:uncharacterized protein LOC116023475 n=1 Tax=Ipomoea triloba TaxID=35885 RepID=UPI00125DE3C8|nr:uncharacterized protein LOC116023475 [Ipomoea triloba]
MGARHVKICTDSALVIGQVTGTFEAKGARLVHYRDYSLSIMGSFDSCVAENANMLSRLSHKTLEYISKVAQIEEVSAACIDVAPLAPVSEEGEDWISDLRVYIETRVLLEDEARARKAKLCAPRFQVEPLATITSYQCARFLWRNVVSRFGVPVQVVTDNRRQFEGEYFQNSLATIGTKSVRALVAYPQGNGQVENANQTILEGLKKKLHSAGRNWADELPYILWSYRTTPRKATKETPFALVYGAEAWFPVEAWIPTS